MELRAQGTSARTQDGERVDPALTHLLNQGTVYVHQKTGIPSVTLPFLFQLTIFSPALNLHCLTVFVVDAIEFSPVSAVHLLMNALKKRREVRAQVASSFK